MSNSRASAASSRAGSKASASAARAIRSSASLASITARSSAASASASSGWSAAPRSIRRAAWRSCASAPSDPPSNSSSPVSALAGLEPRPASPPAPRPAASPRPASGASASISAAAWLELVAVALGRSAAAARLAPVRASSRVDLGPGIVDRRQCRAGRTASSRARWPRGLSRPRSSCWPWISTASAPMSRSSAGGTAGAADEGAAAAVGLERPPERSAARPAPISMPCSASSAMGRMIGRKLEFGGDRRPRPRRCAPARCRRARRAPGPSASSRIDLPAPVSPVSTPSPGSNSRSSRSTSTTSRIDELPQHRRPRRRSISSAAAVLRRVPLDQLVAALVPFAARVIGAEHRGRLLRFLGQAEREIAFDQPLQRLGRVAGGLVFVDHRRGSGSSRPANCPTAGRSGRPPSPCRRDGR